MAFSANLYDLMSMLGHDCSYNYATLYPVCTRINEHEIKGSSFICSPSSRFGLNSKFSCNDNFLWIRKFYFQNMEMVVKELLDTVVIQNFGVTTIMKI